MLELWVKQILSGLALGLPFAYLVFFLTKAKSPVVQFIGYIIVAPFMIFGLINVRYGIEAAIKRNWPDASAASGQIALAIFIGLFAFRGWAARRRAEKRKRESWPFMGRDRK